MGIIRDATALDYFEGGDPSNPTVVLLHGALFLHRMWTPQLEPLRQRFHVLAPDLFYDDDLPRLTVARLAADVTSVVRQHTDKPVYLVGLSYGAVIATQVAINAPERVAGMLLSAPRVKTDFTDRIASWVVNVSPAGPLLNNFLDQTIALVPEMENAVIEDVRRVGKRGMAAMIRALIGVDFRKALPGLTVPTLITVGGDDRPNFVKEADHMRQLLPDAQMKVIPDVGHGWNLEDPDQFTRLTVAFVEAVENETWPHALS